MNASFQGTLATLSNILISAQGFKCREVQETPYFLLTMWKIPYVYHVQTLLFKILVALCFAKFAHFSKSMPD